MMDNKNVAWSDLLSICGIIFSIVMIGLTLFVCKKEEVITLSTPFAISNILGWTTVLSFLLVKVIAYHED